MSERRCMKNPTVSCSVFYPWHILSQWWYFPTLPKSQRDCGVHVWYLLSIVHTSTQYTPNIKCRACCKQWVASYAHWAFYFPCQTPELQVIPVPDITKTPFQGGFVALAQHRLKYTWRKIGEIFSKWLNWRGWKSMKMQQLVVCCLVLVCVDLTTSTKCELH